MTAAGERLLPHAEHLEQLCQMAWRSVQEDIWSGDLRLGSMETTAAVRLPELLAAFHQRAPRVNLQLSTGPSRRLVEGVLSGELDGGLIGGPFEHPQLDCLPIWQEELMLVLPPEQDGTQLESRPQTLLGFPMDAITASALSAGQSVVVCRWRRGRAMAPSTRSLPALLPAWGSACCHAACSTVTRVCIWCNTRPSPLSLAQRLHCWYVVATPVSTRRWPCCWS